MTQYRLIPDWDSKGKYLQFKSKKKVLYVTAWFLCIPISFGIKEIDCWRYVPRPDENSALNYIDERLCPTWHLDWFGFNKFMYAFNGNNYFIEQFIRDYPDISKVFEVIRRRREKHYSIEMLSGKN